jgi:spore coat protein H
VKTSKRTPNRISAWLPAFSALIFAASLGIAAAQTDPRPTKSDDLFQIAKVWRVHLTFRPEQWAAMGLKGGSNECPSSRGFSPAMFMLLSFLEGDENRDGKLSKSEFEAVGEKWFGDCDQENSGKLIGDQLRAGLNSVVAPLEINFSEVHADLDFNGQQFKNVAVRYKGKFTYLASRRELKRSLKIDLNKYIKGQKLAAISTLNFHSNVTDPGWMNEVLSYRLYLDAGVPAPRTAYARVFITVPGKYDGQYIGLYSLVENIDNHFARERFETKKGALFKPDTQSVFTDLGDDWTKYEPAYHPKGDVSDDAKQRVIEFARFVSQADDAEFAAKLDDYLEIEEFARFMAITTWLSTLDSILAAGHNYYVYLDPKSRKFQFLPWDLDLSFGKKMIGGDTRNLSIHQSWAGDNRFLERVFKVEAFKRLYLARLEEFSETICKPERFAQQVNEIAAVIRPAVQEESADRLARFDKMVAGEAVEPTPSGGGPGEYRAQADGAVGGTGFAGFVRDVLSGKPIMAFVRARAKSVSDQLARKSEGPSSEPNFPAGRGRPGSSGLFAPGRIFEDTLMAALDANHDGALTHEEFTQGFARWFNHWNTDKSGLLTERQLRTGISQDLTPSHKGPPSGPNSAIPLPLAGDRRASE